MMEHFDANQLIALISAGAALLGALIGAASTLVATWLSKRIQASGKISLYVKMVYSKGAINKPWGFYRAQQKNGLFMQVPLWLDVCNTSGISRIIRNINLYAYANKAEVAAFTQIQRVDSGDASILLGDSGAYTLVVPANSARRFDLQFMLHEEDLPDDKKLFDELIITYFDEKNIIHAFHFAAVSRCWVGGELERKQEWITLDGRCDYAR